MQTAIFFDLGGILVRIEDDEIAVSRRGRGLGIAAGTTGVMMTS